MSLVLLFFFLNQDTEYGRKMNISKEREHILSFLLRSLMENFGIYCNP